MNYYNIDDTIIIQITNGMKERIDLKLVLVLLLRRVCKEFEYRLDIVRGGKGGDWGASFNLL